MANKRTILVFIVCFSITVLAVITTSRARGSNRASFPTPRPDPKSLLDLTDEERAKAIEKWHIDRRLWERKTSQERIRLMAREAWKHLLRISERQWSSTIEPKINQVYILARRESVRALGSIDNSGHYHWNRPSRKGGPMSGKTREQMPDGYRVIEELIDMLEGENSKDEEIRKKIEALRKVRENARKELAKIGKELAAVLTTPRQEAIFLLMGYID